MIENTPVKENCHETQFENTRVKHRQSANLIIRVVSLHGEKVREWIPKRLIGCLKVLF